MKIIKILLPGFALAVIILIAIMLRVTPILWERDMWYDEAFTGILLKAPWGEMNRMIFADVHPPLYYWLAKPWASLFDYSPFGIRSLSLVFSLLTIFSLYFIGKRMFGYKAALLAASLMALSPFAIEYAQEARMYSLFGFLFLWSVWFFWRALETNKTSHWIWWGILAGLSFYAHYLSLFFFVMFYVSYVGYNNLFEKKSWWRTFFGERGFWIGVGVIGIFFASWIKIFISHMMKGNLGWIEPSYLSDLPKTLQIFLFGHPPGTGGVPWSNEFGYFFDGSSAGLVVLVVLIAGLVVSWQKDRLRKEFFLVAMLSLGTLVFLIILSHLNIKLYVARYFMPAAVLIYLLLGAIPGAVFERRRAWLIYLTCYCLMLSLVKPADYASGWSRISESLKFSGDNSIIVAGDPFSYSTARYYFGEERVRYFNKNNPGEDFSGWVVVGNHNRIVDSREIAENENYLVADKSCDSKTWGIDLEEKSVFRRIEGVPSKITFSNEC